MVNSLRILVADDNEALTQTFTWMLEAMGYEVRFAHTGTEALSVAREFLPHILLLDINLPGVSGYDLCRQLRSEACFKNSLFIAQTGWSQPEHQALSSLAGFNHHLVKPVSIDQLTRLLGAYKLEGAA